MSESLEENLPQLNTWKARLYIFFFGLCMGAADLVPGISGGTIAFIMGFYESLIKSIKSVTPRAIKQLLYLKFSLFSKLVAWQFLLFLILGIATSFLFLAQLVHYFLNHEIYRVLLYSTFMGLTLASIILCGKQLGKWTLYDFVGLFVGATLAFCLTGTTILGADNPHIFYQGIYFDWWLICCGAIAISAMLLPGISGSYLLTILGVYPVAIGSLADFSKHLKNGNLDVNALCILGNLLIGILIGGLVFSHIVSWLLKNHHRLTIALLTGFMVGALRTVWPFWSYKFVTIPLRLDKGVQLQVLDPILPDLTSNIFWISIVFLCFGFGLVFIIEFLASKKTKKITATEPTDSTEKAFRSDNNFVV